MIILGLDPGLRKTGYGIIEKHTGGYRYLCADTINLERTEDLHERLFVLFTAIRDIIKTHRPDCMAIEKVFTGKNVRSALVIGEARAVCILGAYEAGVKVYEYAPRSVKQGITGYGGAEKEDVQRMVRLILGYNGSLKPDAADALALAIFHGNMNTMQERMR